MSNKFWTSETAPVLRAVDAGSCPVLVSGIGAASRAHMAAAARREGCLSSLCGRAAGYQLKLFIACWQPF